MTVQTLNSPATQALKRVFVIDDDEIMLLSCNEILSRAGYRVETYSSGEEGIRRIQESPAPLLFVDLKMPKIDGMEVIRRVRQIDPTMVIVVITGYATIATAVDAMKAGAYDFLPKPFTPDELTMIVNRGFERWHLARESERLRSEKEDVQRKFVTFVSHQLKTPVVAVKQYLDVLMYQTPDDLPERAREWIGRSQYRLAEMLAIIQDWLDLSRLEHGQLAHTEASADVHEVVQTVVQGAAVAAEKAGVTVEIDAPAKIPAVRGDAGSLSMLLGNLVGNAIKYNRPHGRVTVRVALAGVGQGGNGLVGDSRGDDSRSPGRSENSDGGRSGPGDPAGAVRIEIKDTGIGIPADCLDHLFEEFYRVKTASTENIPGTGLGLAICRKIASELGGTVSVASEEGAGTTFTVQLPVHAATGAPTTALPGKRASEER